MARLVARAQTLRDDPLKAHATGCWNTRSPRASDRLETDAAEADRETIVRNFVGQYDNPVRIIAFNTAGGWSRDVSEDIAYEVLDQAYSADEMLTEAPRTSSTGT